jgi:hypothetical protein
MKDANKRFSLVDYVKIYEPSGGPVQAKHGVAENEGIRPSAQARQTGQIPGKRKQFL